MKLHEVLESGKKFRRKGWKADMFVYVELEYSRVIDSAENLSHGFNTTEILADDWEIFEEKIELTESQIREVLNEYWKAGLVQNDVAIDNIIGDLYGVANE